MSFVLLFQILMNYFQCKLCKWLQFVITFTILVQCPKEICIPIEKWEVKYLFHGWPYEAEGGTSGIFRFVVKSDIQGIIGHLDYF